MTIEPVSVSYATLKLLAAAGVTVYYTVDNDGYELYAATDVAFFISSTAGNSSDTTDFVANLQSTAVSVVNRNEALAKAALALPSITFSSGGLTDTQLRASPVPVSATIDTSGLALDATLTGGAQKSIVRGGLKGTTTPADLTGTAEGSDHQALDVQLYHGGIAKDPTQIRALTTADAVNTGQWLGSTAPTVGQKAMASSLPVALASDQSAVPVSGTVTANLGTTGTLVTDANLDEKFGDLGQKASVGSAPVVIASDQSAVPVSAASLPLPAGAATEATLALIKAKTDNLDVALSTRAVTGLTDTQLRASAVPISAASLPLPTGAATETTLAGIKTGTDKIPASPSQEHTTAASPNSARLSDGAAFYDATKTGQLPTALVGGRLDENVGAWLGSTAPTVGSKTSANSVPVVIASDQAAVAVSAASLPLPSGASTEATLATRAASAQLPAALVGGRLDENVGAWLGSTAPTVGQKAMAASLPVAIASDQGVVPPATATAATPTYSEGAAVGLSTDLSGNLRISGTISASTSAHANADAPTYTEDTDDPLSQTLDGRLRTVNSGLEIAQGASMTGQVGPLAQASVSDNPEVFITGEVRPLSLTPDGRLRVSSAEARTRIDFFETNGDLWDDMRPGFERSPWSSW